MKMLVIDDDLILAQYIALQLQALSIESDVSDSGENAHKMFLVNHYDALIVDLVLPGMSGLAVVKEFRQFKPDLPVLFCSGATDTYNKKLMWSLGMVCHKPLDESFPSVLKQFQTYCRKIVAD